MKIDVSKIENYANMSAEEKLAALESFEYEDNGSEIETLRKAVSKANSEAADWKKKHNALISEEQKKKQEESEELENLRKQVAELTTEKLLSEHTAQFVAMGYSEALAKETAKAMVEGDTASVFANQKKFLEDHDKAFKADLLKGSPKPPSGGVGDDNDLSLGAQMAKEANAIYGVSDGKE